MSDTERAPKLAVDLSAHAPMGRADPEFLYDQALIVSQQWLDLWEATGNRRHLWTALTCSRMARERFVNVMAERRNRRLNSKLTFAERYEILEARMAKLEVVAESVEP